jgi:lipocalin
MFKLALTISALLLCGVFALQASGCSNPPPAKNFNLKSYLGVWYETAKYQTFGGGIFERGCKCTKINVTVDDTNTIHAEQSCIKDSKNSSVDALLIPDGQPGKFIEKIFVSKVNFWVIWLDDTNAIEYDCTTNALGETNYCIHLMSRTPQTTPENIKKLSDFALSLGLNKNQLDIQITEQKGCWGSEPLFS